MSQPVHQQIGSGGMDGAPHGAIFRAYQEQRSSRLNLRYLLYYSAALLLLSGLGAWVVSYQQEATPIRVDTAWGLRSVRLGMSPQDVSSVLGQPVSKERRGNLECFQYGRPTLKAPTFVLHTVCYEDGKLREVSEKRFNSWIITQDGAISPAPLEEESPPAPGGDSAPGLAGQTPP